MKLGLNKKIVQAGAIVLLCAMLVVNIVSPLSAFAALSYSEQSGTNQALGSPLLNDNFNYESWNKWEMMTFGVFLSNFTNPLVDSYKTAFTVNNKGSEGAGKKALEFGSGSDSVGNKALASMLDYSVKNQSAGSGKPIQAIYTHINGQLTTEGAPKQATIIDLLISTGDSVNQQWDWDIGSRLTKLGPTVDDLYKDALMNMGTGEILPLSIDGYVIYVLQKASLCRLVVAGDSQGQQETIFDWQNGWDAQMMGAWMVKVQEGEYSSKAQKNLNAMIAAETPLFMDNFGNICGALDGENIVIIPSAANAHIYNEPKYNLLNSIILSESYTDASASSLNKSVEAYKYLPADYKAGRALKKQGGLESGDVVVYFDTDYALFDIVAKNRSKVIDMSLSLETAKLNWGSQLIRLLNSRLDTNSGSNTLGLRIDVIGGEKRGSFFRIADSEMLRLSEDVMRASNILVNCYPVPAGKDMLASITTEKGDAPLFGNSVYVPVNCWSDSDKYNTAIRSLTNSTFKYLDGSNPAVNSKIALENATALKGEMMKRSTFAEVASWMWYSDPVITNADGSKTTGNTKVSKLVKNAMFGAWSNYMSMPSNAAEILSGASLTFGELEKKKIEFKTGTGWLNDKSISKAADNAESRRAGVERVLKIYPKNDTMQTAMNVLGVREGTEFAIWTPRVYLSYLKWFGILDGTNDFNKHLFSESSDLLNKKAEDLFSGTFLTKEEKEAEVLNYTYLMLHPSEGREYRSEMMMNWFTDWIYKTYQNIVYGNSVDSYNTSANTGTRSAAGFLHMDTYEDNFMTSWFMQGYTKYAVAIIGVMLLAIMIVGLLNQKTFAWFIVAIILMVNIVLVTPMVGEMTPYVANNAVQSLFGNKMTYWAMAESITNSKLEKEMAENNGSNESGLTVTDYVRMLNVVYLDRSIMLRADISKKVTEDSTGIISEIQSLNSARWLLPTLIRQFSASDGSADYVYQPIGDIYDNVSNMYWVYKPDDRLNVATTNAATVEIDEDSVPDLTLDYKQSVYEGYKSTASEVTVNPDETEESKFLTYPYNSVSRIKDDENVPHAGFYLIPGLEIPKYTGDWTEYATNPGVDETVFRQKAIEMEQEASSYDPARKGAMVNFGFLWTTENPMHYFYQVVKDTFGSSKTLASFSGDLQGYYAVSSVSGDEERHSFMHYRDTGDIRDIMDLEELFTNVIPYMYSVQLIAGGTEGDNGVLGNTKMSNYELYKDNNKAWLFRSNWVSKLVEDKDLSRPTTVRDSAGTTYKVANPMIAADYPEARPMIFSEAELNDKGLTDADLSLVELKILKVNKAVERSWTMLINYVNTPDITTEVFYRQMATNALLEFNKEFSPDRMINGSKALYPTSLDLRSISFDSVMKMLMINATRDSSYIYGDTMKQVIANSDVFSAILMLLSAFFCSFLIPFVRNIVLGLIFYLGLWAVVCNILAGGITKLKITTAYAINNAVYLAATLLYYAVYAMLINTSTADSVLSLGNIVVNAGPPTWQFFIILGSSIAYIFISVKLISFTVKNYRDLGFEVYASWGNMLANKLSNGMNGIKEKLGFGGGAGAVSAGAAVGGTSRKSRSTSQSDGSGDNINVDVSDTKQSRKNKEAEDSLENASSGYEMDAITEDTTQGPNTFDEEVKKGSNM